jgi:GH43 family beta-xylosidase
LTIVNPLLPIADPFVTRYDGRYYVTGTRTGVSVELWSASSIAALRDARPVSVWEPGFGEPSHLVWSPTLFFLPHHGAMHWFLYFTAAHEDSIGAHRIYVCESQDSDPLGPYTFRGQVAGMADVPVIDPSILRVGKQTYLMYVQDGGGGATPDANVIYVAPLGDPLTVTAPGSPIAYPDQPWERGGDAAQSSYPVAEGPTALYYGERTLIVYSASHTGNYNYCLGLLRYDGATDPADRRAWTKSGPVFTYCEANRVYGPGRAAFTTSPDGCEDWMLYHAKDTKEFTFEGRTTRAQRFGWHPDGTPDFGTPAAAEGTPR